MAVRRLDVAIIGGGAAGLFAAVILGRALKDRNVSIVIFEKSARVGRKLISTGNGTCNITNTVCSVDRYHGADPSFVKKALDNFTPEMALEVFSSAGVECYTRDDGKAYPICEQASSVLDCLRMEARSCGVEELCGCAVSSVKKKRSSLILETESGTFEAVHVLVCAGGAAFQSLGGCSEGYSLLTSLGHIKTPLFASIVQVKTETNYVKSLKGIRVDGRVAFLLNERELVSESGEILFTEYGISGPAVMQISRCVGDWERKKRGEMSVRLDLMERFSQDDLVNLLERRTKLKGRLLEDLFTGLLNKRLGQTLIRVSGLDPLSRPVNVLGTEDIVRLAKCVKGWRIGVVGTQGLSGAQVTAGGISTSEFDDVTMMSKLVPNLYAAGEVLDVDGDCGGFNLQWAWSSAYAACCDIVRKIEEDDQVDVYSLISQGY